MSKKGRQKGRQGWHHRTGDYKKVARFFRKNRGVTPSVAAQGVTHHSEATGWNDSFGCWSRCVIVTRKKESRIELYFITMCLNKKLSYRIDNACRRSLRRLRSFKVAEFGTNRKPICNFLLVMNINLHPISRRSQIIVYCWSNLHFLPFFNTLAREWIHKLTTTKFGLK